MDEPTALTWAVHHMVVDYYHTLIDSVRKNITIPKLRFEDFYPVAQERITALIPFIKTHQLSCLKEAERVLSWDCREKVEIEIINKVTAFNRRIEHE